MTDNQRSAGTRFGRTIVSAVAGKAIDQQVHAVVYAANARGIMGAGTASAIRLAAGPEVEREAMAGAPHDLGTAFLTGAGNLTDRGIQSVIHAVIAPALGDSPRLHMIQRAVGAALRVADNARVRNLAMPLLGLPSDADEQERGAMAEHVVDEVVAYLRRGTTRLEQIVIAAGLADEAAAVDAAIRRARERSWLSKP
ncbi:MAG: macro domain-containing protein [Thermomicrobiales bacterium]